MVFLINFFYMDQMVAQYNPVILLLWKWMNSHSHLKALPYEYLAQKQFLTPINPVLRIFKSSAASIIKHLKLQ